MTPLPLRSLWLALFRLFRIALNPKLDKIILFHTECVSYPKTKLFPVFFESSLNNNDNINFLFGAKVQNVLVNNIKQVFNIYISITLTITFHKGIKCLRLNLI